MGRKSAAVRERSIEAVCDAPLARPRERVIAAARELFHRQGIHNVGVEAIAEAAGTNKMTLYRHFGSKDELIVECLRAVAAEGDSEWRQLAAQHAGDPMAHLRAWVRQKAEFVLTDGRGCTLVNAAVELTEPDHPARQLIEEKKRAYRDRLVQLCAAAGIAQAELLADTLSLLLEGARVSRQSAGAEGPSARYLRMSEAVIAAFKSGA